MGSSHLNMSSRVYRPSVDLARPMLETLKDFYRRTRISRSQRRPFWRCSNFDSYPDGSCSQDTPQIAHRKSSWIIAVRSLPPNVFKHCGHPTRGTAHTDSLGWPRTATRVRPSYRTKFRGCLVTAGFRNAAGDELGWMWNIDQDIGLSYRSNAGSMLLAPSFTS